LEFKKWRGRDEAGIRSTSQPLLRVILIAYGR